MTHNYAFETVLLVIEKNLSLLTNKTNYLQQKFSIQEIQEQKSFVHIYLLFVSH